MKAVDDTSSWVRIPGRVYVRADPTDGTVQVRIETETGERFVFNPSGGPIGTRAVTEDFLRMAHPGRRPSRWWG